jgi:hypothetical protein
MVLRRSLAPWWLAVASAAAFVVGASAQSVAPRSQGVVTPEDPIFGQDPAPTPAPTPTPTPETPETPDPSQTPAATPAAGASQTPTLGRGGRGGRPLTYAEFRRDVKTDDGIFKVHRIRDQIFFEIPKKELGKDYLWVSQIKRTTIGAGFGGQEYGDRVVRWELHNDRVFLKTVDFGLVADPAKPMAQAVADANVPAIIRAFSPLVTSPDGNPVIDVTGLFLGDVAEFSPRTRLGARGMDQTRSYLEKVVSFPENINAQLTMTYTSAAPGDAPATGRGRGGLRGSSGTVVVFHSLVKLPEQPMVPRLADARVGYFSTSMYDYGRDENKSVERTYITRYRLEKKDQAAAVSDPVKPIVYYVDPATPAKLVPWIKKGIEAWKPAFETAGFSNAIVAKDAPTKEEDPDWDPEDARYSVVRWLPSTEENASGPHVHDPRSGEILEADVQVFHNVQNLAAMWYFAQVASLDSRAQKLPLPDAVLGRLVQFVVSHEIGHTLGFQHNMKASSLYSVAQVRDKDWVKENGHTPSIMDYSRFNYVAQPEDGIALDDLIPKIGPSDKWATMWGYKPIPGAKTPDAEKATLNDWAREQETKPYLRFTTSNSLGSDPGEQTEAVGDADPTQATELGLRNLRKIAGMLVTATDRPGEPYDDLSEVYGRVVTQWRLEMGHVANVIGGMSTRELYVGQQGPRFTPVAKPRQVAALQFLQDNAFQTPQFLVNTDLLRRIEPSGVVSRIRIAQNSLMNALLSNARLNRMVEESALDPKTYTPLQFLSDLRRGVWKELATPAVPIGLYRRNVQRVYIDTINDRLNGAVVPTAEIRALLRGELRGVDQQIASALPGVTDVATRRHLDDMRETIRTVLDPRAMREASASVVVLGGRGLAAPVVATGKRALVSSEVYDYDNDPFLLSSDACFADVTIK